MLDHFGQVGETGDTSFCKSLGATDIDSSLACRGKDAWLEINLFTTRSTDSLGVNQEPFCHQEELDKLMQQQLTARQKARPMAILGSPSALFFRPR